jgi:hypothetical protein
MLAQRFQPRLMPDRFPVPFPTVTLRPAGGVPVRLEAAEIRASPGMK